MHPDSQLKGKGDAEAGEHGGPLAESYHVFEKFQVHTANYPLKKWPKLSSSSFLFLFFFLNKQNI